MTDKPMAAANPAEPAEVAPFPAAARAVVQLAVNGQACELAGADVFAPLTELLRDRLGLTGTKVVCAEGDCGACCVLVGRAAADSTEPTRPREYRSACACILCPAQLDGAHVVTVEGLRPEAGPTAPLHPIQQAMVDHHGSQCGFCTPGFVVGLAAAFESAAASREADPNVSAPDEAAVRHALGGNLCRCTGYVSILSAAAAVEASQVPRLNVLYPPERLPRAEPTAVLVREPRTLYVPRTLAEAVAFRARHPDCAVIAGGTELGVLANKANRRPPVLLSLAAVAGLDRIGLVAEAADSLGKTRVEIGANVTWSAAEAFFAVVEPEFAAIIRRFGSPPIRNVATVVGNLANASPIADALPYLHVSDAVFELTGPAGTRTVAIEQFNTGYKLTAVGLDELITRVTLTPSQPGELLRLYKVSKRTELDISTVGAAIRLRLSGDRIAEARVAFNGVAATVIRLPTVEAELVGRPIREDTFAHAGRLAAETVRPLSDVRGSAEYRRRLVENLLRKFAAECSAERA